jgi:hypothetical protein
MATSSARNLILDQRPAVTSAPSDDRQIDDLDALAQLMDSAVRIPGTRISVGLDAVLGLVPGLGDAASALVSLHILSRAQRLGVGRATLTRMATNIVWDSVFGAVPLAGDVFDVFWKANRRNIALLRQHVQTTPARSRQQRRSDRLFVGATVVALIALAIAGFIAAYFVLTWLLDVVRAFVT